MKAPGRNIAASVRARLFQVRQQTGTDYNELLMRFCLERLLHRLGRSSHSKSFLLKGAMLFVAWGGETRHRATRDLDLLGMGDPIPEESIRIFRDIAATPVDDDGVTFPPERIRAEAIREDARYEGVRVQLVAQIENAVIPLQVDIGFGDAVTPQPDDLVFPSLLGFPAPVLRAYPRQTVIAEKVEAILLLGMLNSRMKDYFDLWYLAQNASFRGDVLVEAVRATCERRETAIPTGTPTGLSATFGADPAKQVQWRAFWKKAVRQEEVPLLTEVVGFVRDFVMPILTSAANGDRLGKDWPVGGPWRASPAGSDSTT